MLEPKKKVLIVDDEPAIRDSLRLLLSEEFDVSLAADGEVALSLLSDVSPDIVLLDVMMPKLDGIETLKKLRSQIGMTPVIMLSAVTTVRTAVQAMKFGAVDFISKPFEIAEIIKLIHTTLDTSEIRTQVLSEEKSMPRIEADFGPMVGKSEAMTHLFEKINQVAVRDTTVLITGESGTGKELIARRIHDISNRHSGPFIAINCAAIPETLIESELFGHEKGAFTHAVEKRLGHFELADGGTLFLDEIGELSLGVQVKMLRFLQEQEFYRVGRSKPIKVNVRIVAATNRNLEDLVREKKFREDLFYRVNVINLHVPPLRDRFDDVQNLIEFFLKRLQLVYKGKEIRIDDEAMAQLVSYEWPGNVRELENVVESLLALNSKPEIAFADLPAKIRERSVPVSAVSSTGPLAFEEAEKKFEADMILKALKRANFVQTRAAELLGISRRILKYKMDKLGINEKGENVEYSGPNGGEKLN